MCGDRLLQRAIVLNRVCYSRLFVTTKTTLKKRIEHLELDTNTYEYAYGYEYEYSDKKDNLTSEEVANGDRDQVQPLELQSHLVTSHIHLDY